MSILTSDNIREISSHLSPLDNHHFKITCKFIHEIIPVLSKLLIKSIDDTLKEKLQDEYCGFKRFLHISQSILTGEFLLQCLLGENWENCYIDIITFNQPDMILKWLDNPSIFQYFTNDTVSYDNSYFINIHGKDCINFKSMKELVNRGIYFENEPVYLNGYNHGDVLIKRNSFQLSTVKVIGNILNFEMIYIQPENDKFKLLNDYPKYYQELKQTGILIEDGYLIVPKNAKILCDFETSCDCPENKCDIQDEECLNIMPGLCHEDCPVGFFYKDKKHFSVEYEISYGIMTTIFII